MNKRPPDTPVQVRPANVIDAPDPADPNLFNRIPRATPEEKIAFDEFLYGMFENKFPFRCPSHLHCSHTLISHGHSGAKNKRPIRRVKCFLPDGSHHTFSLAHMWYQLPSSKPVPPELWPAIKSCISAGYVVPKGERLTTRPAPMHLIEQAERNRVGEDRGRLLEDGSPAPLSPRGLSFRKEGEEFMKALAIRDKRSRAETHEEAESDEDRVDDAPFPDLEENKAVNLRSSDQAQAWQIPSKPPRNTTSAVFKPGRLLSSNKYSIFQQDDYHDVVNKLVLKNQQDQSREARDELDRMMDESDEDEEIEAAPSKATNEFQIKIRQASQEASENVALSPRVTPRMTQQDIDEIMKQMEQPTVTLPHHLMGTPSPAPRPPPTRQDPIELLRKISSSPAQPSPLRQTTSAAPQPMEGVIATVPAQQNQTAQPKRFYTESYAMEQKIPFATVARQRPSGAAKDVVLPPKAAVRPTTAPQAQETTNADSQRPRIRPLTYTEEERRLIYGGRDPRKSKLTEIHIEGLKRTRISDIRGALRADGVNTKEIIDLYFVGGTLTVLVIPAAQETSIRSQLGKITHFTVLASFDPLDISRMRSMEKYNGKTDAELFLEAKRMAKDRLSRMIRKLPVHRAGTKKWHERSKRIIDERTFGSSAAPQERTLAQFVVPAVEGASNGSAANTPANE